MIKISAMPLSVLLFFAIVNVKIVSPYDAVKRRDYMSRNEEQDNDRVQNKGRGQDKAKESTKEDKQEEALRQHEDVALKVGIRFFADELLP